MFFDCRYESHALGIGIVSMEVIWMKSNMDGPPSINLKLSQMGKFSVSLVCSEIADVCTRSMTAQDIRLCLCV